MTETPFAADRLLAQALDALDACAESGGDAELLAVLTRCESAVRRLDRVTVSAVASLERRGRSPSGATGPRLRHWRIC